MERLKRFARKIKQLMPIDIFEVYMLVASLLLAILFLLTVFMMPTILEIISGRLLHWLSPLL